MKFHRQAARVARRAGVRHPRIVAMNCPPAKVTVDSALARLPLPANTEWPLGVWDVEALRHGTMSVVLFAPREHDYQSAHHQDELYVVVAGAAELAVGEAGALTRHACRPGDVLFVPARTPHRFEKFSADFVTWAIFWGPADGETSVRLPAAAPP